MSEVTLVSLVKNFGWVVEKDSAVQAVENALRSRGKVGLCSEIENREGLFWGATGRVEVLDDPGQLQGRSFDAAIVVTHRLVEEQLSGIPYPVAVIRPKNLVVGLSSVKPVETEDLELRIRNRLLQFGFAWSSILVVATNDLDPSKAVIDILAASFKIQCRIFSENRLEEVACFEEVVEPRGLRLAESAAFLASESFGIGRLVKEPESLEGSNYVAVLKIDQWRA